MKTLFLTNSYLVGNSGGVYASRTHINLFAELSESMTLVYPNQRGKEASGISEDKLTMVPVDDYRSKIRKYLDLLMGKVHRFNLKPEYLDSNKYDLVVFDNSVVSSGFVKRFKKAGIKTITIHHNYQIEYLLGDSSLITLVPNLFWTWIYEKQAVKYSDLNITLTRQDIDLLKRHYDWNASFAVLGVFEYQRGSMPVLPQEERRHRYVITGGLGFKQTERSLIRWIQDYFPILIKEDPGATLTIAGSNPSSLLANVIAEAGIRLIASPKDMKPILNEADYYICPIDRGGGLKLRVMDGLKMGLPVLSHKVSVRGYETMQDAGFVFSYSNRESFIKGVQQLTNIKVDRCTIQNTYNNCFNFEEGILKLKRILEQFV